MRMRRFPTDDRELLVAARQDSQAFAEFYRRRVRGILAFFRGRGLSTEQSLDLTAEVFAAALASIDRYRPGPEPAAAWLYGIARNKLAESLRRGTIESRAREQLVFEPLEISDAGLGRVESELSPEVVEELHRLLAQLPDEQREALLGRLVDERSYADLASQLACSELVVRKRVSRGLQRLRAQVRKEGI
jgi:RNA polymerase sigma-70 factor (ECF subfamily)